jgi:hypothetical protein
LHAAPQAPRAIAKARPTKEKAVTRIEKMQTDGLEPDLPPLHAGQHLIDYLMQAGPLAYGGMGPAPLSHGEIQAWQLNTGIELNAWEANTLRTLSRDYVAQLQVSSAADEPAPYVAISLQDERRTAVSQRVGSIFGGLARRQAARTQTERAK